MLLYIFHLRNHDVKGHVTFCTKNNMVNTKFQNYFFL